MQEGQYQTSASGDIHIPQFTYKHTTILVVISTRMKAGHIGNEKWTKCHMEIYSISTMSPKGNKPH